MQDHHTRDEVGPRPVARATSPSANLALLLISLLSSLLVIEIGYRFVAGLPVVKWTNWRVDAVSANRLGERAVFDPVIGWSVKPWTDIDGFETIDHGIRRNFQETVVRTGAVLAVGDSFTEGWEVADAESWPAVLEQMSGVPVVNAGVGGYGTDQIIMRAEQLIPIAKPKVLIVGFLESDIDRAGHSVFGAPKPYFSIENNELRYHPPEPLEPVATSGLLSSIAYRLRDALGYSAAADFLLARLSPNYWYSTGSEVHSRRADIDEAEVTCRLLQRLKAQTDKEGIRTLLFMQYYAGALFQSEKPRNGQRVLACAQQAGIRVLDHFASLRGMVAVNPYAMKEYYIHGGDTYGHMSAKGNRHAAYLLSLALQDWLAALPGARQTTAAPSTPSVPTDTASE